MIAVVAMLLSAALVTASPTRTADALIGASARQQSNTPESARDVYLRYRQTAAVAKSVAEIMAFWSSDLVEAFKKEPEDVRAGTVEMVRRMEGSLADVRVLEESATATRAILSLEATGPGRAPMTGSVELVKEKGAWKLTEAEQWKPKSERAQQ